MESGNFPLQFTIEILSAHFSSPGRYFLVLRIVGSKVKPSTIKLYVGNSQNALDSHEFTTDACLEDGDLDTFATFNDSLISFWMPAGSANGDIRLVLEAFRLPENPMHKEVKYGEAVFEVFPRKTPFFSNIRQKTPSSDNSNEVYQFETNIKFTQILKEEGFSTNCGLVRATVKLDQIKEPETEEPVAEAKTVAEPVAEPVVEAKTVAQPVAEAKAVEKPQPVKPLLLPVPGDPGPGPSSAAEVSFTNRIQESALGNNVESIPIHHLCGSYLARAGYCEVAILAHGAIGLPLNSHNRPPQPYIVGKSGKREAQGLVGQSVTHAATHTTQSSCWEELLLVEIKEEEAENEVVILLIADHPSKELLTEYKVPLEHIKPFHQYHLELVQPNSELNSDSRLYVTLMKKMDKLPLPPLGSNVYGLEVLLRSFEQQLHSQMGPLIATLRIVSDWEEYRETMLSPQPRPTGVTVTTIQFPSPHPTLFAVAGATTPHGAPQVTTAGRPQEQPRWNQTLLFLGEESSLFTVKSACVVEYYPAALAMTKDSWQLTSPIGYSYQSLDQLLLSSLQCDEAKLGLKLDNIPVEGSKLRTVTRTCPTIGLVARLITEERPEPYLIAATNLASLPAFRAKLPTDQQSQLSHVNRADMTTYRQMSHGLPTMDAVKSILPHFHSLYTGPRTEPVQEHVPLMISSPPVRGTSVASDGTPNPAQVRGSIDDKNLAVMDYQMKEVDRYRTAMRTMATDLLHVREDCKRLEEENSRFRRDLTQHDEISRLMVSSQDLDHITHSELVQKFVLLKKKLADESNKKQELQNRLLRLQNDLIKKNETEKEYCKLQEAHEGQQALLQELQIKVQKRKAIQDTCKKQEKVIVQLEKLLAQQRQGHFNGVAETSDTYRFLSDENTKLQSEVSQYKEMLRQVEAKQKLPRSPDKHITSEGPMSDLERLELYEKLERAEGRIVALEKQLADNVRKWAKDKADLQMKLNERTTAQKTGFKTSTSASMDILDWHNGPKPPSPARHLGPRRPSPKLEPLERR
ncbi:coiled-coil domain-containing protein 33-like isoform X3 [Acropora muricata]|uniref:coiled-coil domain-containing protein 33-like isoform X3 n=1 Tax=Acropora muricata TaxID=159855 RepID=UPI0034E4EDEC